MQLNLHIPSETQFNNYTDSSVTIKGQEYFNDIIVYNSTVSNIESIYNINELNIKYLNDIVNQKPDLIILGTASKIIYPNSDIILNVQTMGIGIEVMTIKSLCRTFNFLVSENRKIAAFLFFNIN